MGAGRQARCSVRARMRRPAPIACVPADGRCRSRAGWWYALLSRPGPPMPWSAGEVVDAAVSGSGQVPSRRCDLPRRAWLATCHCQRCQLPCRAWPVPGSSEVVTASSQPSHPTALLPDCLASCPVDPAGTLPGRVTAPLGEVAAHRCELPRGAWPGVCDSSRACEVASRGGELASCAGPAVLCGTRLGEVASCGGDLAHRALAAMFGRSSLHQVPASCGALPLGAWPTVLRSARLGEVRACCCSAWGCRNVRGVPTVVGHARPY
jgi:hypothetical protein